MWLALTASTSPRCSTALVGPSSSISPSTAMRRPRGPIAGAPSPVNAPPPAPPRGFDLGQRRRRERKIGARERRRSQHRQRVHRHVTAGHAELVGHVKPENVGMYGPTAGGPGNL